MESIEEQWNQPLASDILSNSWTNITDAKKAVKTWILDRAESWAPSHHNDKRRLQLHCLSKGCSFHIRIAQKKDGLFGIICYTPHDCPPSTHAKFKQRNSAWYLASLLERDIAVNRQIKPKEIQERARIYHQLPRVPYMPAWRARERVRDIHDGDEGASFQLIEAWATQIIENDTTGTYIALETSSKGRFKALFVMLGSIRSRLKTLRPFYALDGTHTRSQYNLTLLIAVGIDAEDHILPLAWALVPGEDETWWSWFCEHLALAFESDLLPEYVIISDRDKGLLNAVESKLPGAYHAMCCQHIAENVHKKFGREHKAPFWQIARAQSQSAFDTAVQALQRDSPQVEEYLSLIGYKNFAFACFPLPRYGHDTSNIVESTNSAWREIRELPPLQLIDGIYQWTLTTFYERQRVGLDSGNQKLSNAAYRSYKHRESIARGFQVLPSSDSNFLVTTSQGVDFIVILPAIFDGQQQGSCSCGKYQEYRAPCSHAIACIQYLGQDPYKYFASYYKWKSLQRTYELPLQPVTLQGLQPLDNDPLLPPIKKAKRGRPKVARIRANYKIDKRIHCCSVCSQAGHNRRVCPNQPVEHGRAQKVRDQRIIDGKC
jgi:MULE transposase domain/SWIM zinc finger